MDPRAQFGYDLLVDTLQSHVVVGGMFIKGRKVLIVLLKEEFRQGS